MNKLVTVSVLVFYVLIIGHISLCQNKKQQIAILTFQKDSLKRLYQSDSTSLNNDLNQINSDYRLLSEKFESVQLLIKEKSNTIQTKSALIQSLNIQKMDIMKENNELKKNQNILKLKLDSLSNLISNTRNLLPLWHSNPNYLLQETINSYLTAKNSKLVSSISFLEADKLKFSFVIHEIKEDRFVNYDNQIAFGYKHYLKYYIGSFSDEIFTLEEQWEQSVGPSEFDDGIGHVDFQLTDIDQDGEYEVWYVNDSFEGISDVSPTLLTIYFYNASTINEYTASTCDGIMAREFFGLSSDYSISETEEFVAQNIAQLKTQIDESSIYFNFLSELVRKNSCGAP